MGRPGSGGTTPRQPHRPADAAAPPGAHVRLALLVSQWESTTSRNTWRRPSDRDRRYLSALTAGATSPPTSNASSSPTPNRPRHRADRAHNTAEQASRTDRRDRVGQHRRATEPTEPPSRPSRRSRSSPTTRRADWSGGLTGTRHRGFRLSGAADARVLAEVTAALSGDERMEGVRWRTGSSEDSLPWLVYPLDRPRPGVEGCRGRPTGCSWRPRVRQRAAPAGFLRGDCVRDTEDGGVGEPSDCSAPTWPALGRGPGGAGHSRRRPPR